MRTCCKMKAHNYLFKISYLELYYPVIVNDDIYIIPNSVNMRDEIEFYNKPLGYPKFNLKFSHPEIEKWIEEQTGKERKIKEETSKVYFKISKITVIKI